MKRDLIRLVGEELEVIDAYLDRNYAKRNGTVEYRGKEYVIADVDSCWDDQGLNYLEGECFCRDDIEIEESDYEAETLDQLDINLYIYCFRVAGNEVLSMDYFGVRKWKGEKHGIC